MRLSRTPGGIFRLSALLFRQSGVAARDPHRPSVPNAEQLVPRTRRNRGHLGSRKTHRPDGQNRYYRHRLHSIPYHPDLLSSIDKPTTFAGAPRAYH